MIRTGLGRHVRLGIEHMLNSLDERRGYLPFFFFRLVSKTPSLSHGPFDAPHVVGRCLDALAKASRFDEMTDDLPQVPALAYYLHNSIEEDGLVWNTPTKSQKYEVVTHNFREALLGLVALGVWKKSDESLKLARKVCLSVERLTRDGTFPGVSYNAKGWADTPSNHWHGLTGDTGRLIGALVEYSAVTNDSLGIELGTRFASFQLEKSFSEKGEVREAAKPHVHSITSTLSGIVALARQMNDSSLIENAKRVYDLGLKRVRTEHGWVKELWTNEVEVLKKFYPNVPKRSFRGEANNTGDLIELALGLAKLGYHEYYQDAERMIRNQLISSQLQDIDWIEESDNLEDTWETVYHGVARRARGGFGFCTPNDFADIDNHPDGPDMNADLAGGAIRALCAAWDNMVTSDSVSTRINLLFSCETDVVHVESKLFSEGNITIIPKRKTAVFVRVPQYSDRTLLTVKKNGMPIPPYYNGSYVIIWNVNQSDVISVQFKLATHTTEETIEGLDFRFSWLGDAVTSVSPRARFRGLYDKPPVDL